MRISIIILSLLLFSSVAFTQSSRLPDQLTGWVADIDKQPLPSAQLILKNGEKIIGFGMTNAEGTFTLELPNTVSDTTTLEARYFGYATKSFPSSAWGDGSNLRITLRAENVELKEVVVSADALPQLIKEDTISFRTEAYRDGSEDKIEDVIAKLPGVEVNDNGDISVNGKALDRILLDGEDVFDRSYKTLSRNVPANYVEQIDVLNNYQPDQLTGDLNGTGETVMDLRLDPARKSLAFGSVSLAGGTEDYRHAETNLFLLRRKTKLINFGRYTTAGGEASPGSSLQQRTAGSPGNLGAINAPVLTSAATRQQRLVPVGDYLRNQGLGMAQSLLLTPTPHLRNRLIINVGRDTSVLNENRSRELVTDAGTNGFTLNGQYSLDRLNLWLKNDFNLLLNQRTRLDIETTLIKQRTLAGINVLSTDQTLGTSEETTTDLRSEPLTYNFDLRLVRRLNDRMAFTLKGSLTREQFDQFQVYQGSVYNDLLQDNALAFGQTINRTYSGHNFDAVLLQRLGKQRLRYAVGYRTERTQTIASLAPLNTSEEAENDINHKQEVTFAEVAWNYKLKKWELNAMTRANYFRLPYRIGQLSQPIRFNGELAPEASFSAKRQLTRRSKLSGSISQTFRAIGSDQAIPVSYISGQTSVTAGIDSAFLLKALSADLNYRYNNTFRQYGYGMRLNHTVQPNAVFQQLMAEDFLFVNQITPGGRSAVSSLSTNAYGTIPKTSTRIEARVTLFRFSDLVSFTGTPINTINNSVAAELKVNTPVGNRIKLSSQAKWQRFATSLEGERGQQQQLYLKHNIVLTIAKNLRAIAQYRTFFPRLGTQQAAVHLFGQTVSYKPQDKSWSLSARVINLFNQKTVVERSIEPYLRTSRSYQLRPRTFYFQVNVDL